MEARRPLSLLLSNHLEKWYGLTKLVTVRRMEREEIQRILRKVGLLDNGH